MTKCKCKCHTNRICVHHPDLPANQWWLWCFILYWILIAQFIYYPSPRPAPIHNHEYSQSILRVDDIIIFSNFLYLQNSNCTRQYPQCCLWDHFNSVIYASAFRLGCTFRRQLSAVDNKAAHGDQNKALIYTMDRSHLNSLVTIRWALRFFLPSGLFYNIQNTVILPKRSLSTSAPAEGSAVSERLTANIRLQPNEFGSDACLWLGQITLFGFSWATKRYT